MLALSPRAVERLQNHRPERPLPKIFRLTSQGKLLEGPFRGQTINTPSLLCVEDALDGLRWAESIGGLPGLVERSRQNLEAMTRWVNASAWAEFLAQDPATRSSTSMCLAFSQSALPGMDDAAKRTVSKRMENLLADEGVAYDIGAYRDAPPGLRVWGGATVATPDLEALTPWLDWAFAKASTG